jgi:hypothetical protein
MKIRIFAFFAIAAFVLMSCDTLFQEELPTKTKMESVWEVTSVLNAQNQEIVNQLRFPILAFHLSSDNTVVSTAGPLVMYIVYGENKYAEITSKLDQVFNYASLNFNGGEFFVGGGTQSRFTVEMKIEGVGGVSTLTTLLELIGINPTFQIPVIYHKFMDVKVTFYEKDETMVWEFDSATKAVYNTKDQYGNYVLWQGWPVDGFQRCKITLKKRSKELRDLVQDAS